MRHKSILWSAVLSAAIGVSGCTRYQQKDYTIGVPIENCSKVSYDNHHLTNNGVNIYCPSGSLVVAAMDGIVSNIQCDSAGWIVETICRTYNLQSRYSLLSSVKVSIGDTINMYDSIGVLAMDQDYLHYELFREKNDSIIYLSPLSNFNSYFE